MPHTSRDSILHSKILKVVQPRLAKQGSRRSIFAFCASSTNVISISRHFRLRKAKCESSAHTHHTRLDFTFSSNLGLFSCEATKNTYVDFSVLTQGNMLRCFFINPICFFVDIWILPLANPLDICPSCASPFDIFSLSLKFDMRHSAQENKKPRFRETAYITRAKNQMPLFLKMPIKNRTKNWKRSSRKCANLFLLN